MCRYGTIPSYLIWLSVTAECPHETSGSLRQEIGTDWPPLLILCLFPSGRFFRPFREKGDKIWRFGFANLNESFQQCPEGNILKRTNFFNFMQCCASRSVGSVCIWASRIRILHLKKNSKKNLDSYCFVTSLLHFLSLKNDVIVPSKRPNKVPNKGKIIFFGVLKVTD